MTLLSASTRAKMVNPRLGTYFSIFASMLTGLFFVLLIFEQLNVGDRWIKFALFAVPILIYTVIGLLTSSRETLDYFAAGRRVPSGYTGLLLAAGAIGSTFLVAGVGAFFFSGFDALVLMLGVVTGLVLMAMVLAPFYRKFGAYTLPSYLGRRFESRPLRIVAAVIAIVPMLLMLAAEIRLGSFVAQKLVGVTALMPFILSFSIVACTIAGGTRSFTWAGVAQAIAMFLTLFAVATTVSVLITGLPIPQLANGPMVRGLVRNEVGEGLQAVLAGPLAFSLPGEGFAALTKPYTLPFGNIGPLAFLLGVVAIATGVATAPWLLPRVAASPGVYEARKALGWATAFAGLAMLTVSSVAVFMRDFVLDTVMSERVGPLPDWLYEAANAGLVAFDHTATRLTFETLKFDRDGVLFALPIAAELPRAFEYVLLAGALAAALLSASATIVSLAAVLSEDIVQGPSWEPATPARRIWIMRCLLVIVAFCGALLTSVAPTDPLRLVLWALSITGSALFPVMLLSVWWKRLTPQGAVAGLASGFAVAALAIFSAEASAATNLPSAIAGILGLPVALAASLIVSVLRPETSRHTLEVVRDIRVPGGEIIYDREMQRLQIRKQART